MSKTYLKSATDTSLEIPQNVTESVRDIVDTVRERGDAGVREFTRKSTISNVSRSGSAATRSKQPRPN
jgi:histidinol dehydrogenase